MKPYRMKELRGKAERITGHPSFSAKQLIEMKGKESLLKISFSKHINITEKDNLSIYGYNTVYGNFVPLVIKNLTTDNIKFNNDKITLFMYITSSCLAIISLYYTFKIGIAPPSKINYQGFLALASFTILIFTSYFPIMFFKARFKINSLPKNECHK